MTNRLLERLQDSPVQYRHALGVLDPEYVEWRPEGRPEYDLHFVGSLPLLVNRSHGVCMLLGNPSGAEAQQVMREFAGSQTHELSMLGESAFRTASPFTPDGAWRLSRNYELTADSFRSLPSDSVRRLMPDDRKRLEIACRTVPALGESSSTHRDFDYMAHGLPVTCYGAFVEDELVGLCSTNPMCRGVTEISWIVVGAEYRRLGLASGLLTAACEEAFCHGDAVGYYAGSAGDDLHRMVLKLGFRELLPNYRFIPASSPEQWRLWGKPV